jgi:5-methylcytosine-specific restriction endonuclease McrBC GTP-binding regulatory subunit McrB
VSKHYLFLGRQHETLPFSEQRLILEELSSPYTVDVNDQFLILPAKGLEYASVWPAVMKVVKVDHSTGNVTLDTGILYNNRVSVDHTRNVLNRAPGVGINLLTQGEFEAIVAEMGEKRMKEKEMLQHVKQYVAAKGYYFDDETLYNYHICLKTRPLVILAGLSGTGKSKLSQLYAEAIGHNNQNGHYLRLAVRPSWNDDRFLLGYQNTITGEYVTEPALDFIIRAEADRDNLYFFCLDEMNLAHVEYYFSQFLSALEEEPSARKLLLMSETAKSRWQKEGAYVGIPSEVLISTNLLFTGTINVDETTQALSDKVIDRANTLEFFDIELDKIPDRRPLPAQISISAPAWQSYFVDQPDTSHRSQILAINTILKKADLGIGFRVLRDIELYLANSKNILAPSVALDLQIKQRILPRVRGSDSEAMRGMLESFIDFVKQNKLSRSQSRLEEMKARLGNYGYTSFWR